MSSLLDTGYIFSLFIYITVLVQHVDSRNSYLVELDTSIVYSIESYFHTHILQPYPLTDATILFPYFDQECMDAFLLAMDDGLGEYHSIVGMHGPIGDPVLLGQSRRRVDDELTSQLVPGGCGLHFDGIVAIA